MEKRWAAAVLSLLMILAATSVSALQLTSPEFGVAQSKAFDVEITTATALECRYSSPFQKSYAEMAAFTETGTTTHALAGFEVPNYGSEYAFFINCGNGAETAQLKMRADNINPGIQETKAEPQKVVQAPLETRMTVKTSEKTSCKYDTETDDYDSMAEFFSGPDSNEGNYLEDHHATLSSLEDEKDYTYKVKCRDLAGRFSGAAAIAFSVNTKAPPEVINFTPKHNSYTTNNQAILSITTNKNSACTYRNESGGEERQDGSFNIEGTTHEATLELEDRSYTYHFNCIFEGPLELNAQTTFTIDNTPPEMKSVNDSQKLKDVNKQYTYKVDELQAKFEAEDTQSGIKQYNYTIVSGSKTIANWTTTTKDEIRVDGLELEDGSKYVFRAKAQNNAGLWSEIMESDGVIVDVSLNLEEACSNNRKDNDESDVDCGGSCPAKCGLGNECNEHADCASGLCSEGNECVRASCNDGIRNQDETDADCGGSCRKCLEGDKCETKNDCSTGICSEGICTSPGPCYNGVKDGFETDVDCGGICAELKDIQCIRGKGCIEDSDCTSGTCGIDGKCAAVNDPDYDTIASSRDNCPRVENRGQEDVDNDGIGDACDNDNDNDGMANEWEEKYNLNQFDASDAELDSDGDGLTNRQEFESRTNPHSPDTDGDGHSDAKEVARGTNPLDKNSKPGAGRMVKVMAWMLAILAVFVTAAFIYYRKLTGPARETKKELERRKAQDAADATEEARQQKARSHVNAAEFKPQLQPPRVEEERKYRPKPLYHPIPPPKKHAKGNVDAIREEHSKLSGEEVFERLKKHTRKRRRS